MHLQTYYCQTISEALGRVRRELGDGAAVLHVRTVRRGVLRKRVLEVVATDTPPDELPTDGLMPNALSPPPRGEGQGEGEAGTRHTPTPTLPHGGREFRAHQPKAPLAA